MKFAAEPITGIHIGTKYVWNCRAEGISRDDVAPSNTNPCYQVLGKYFPVSFEICEESNPRANVFLLREFGSVLRIWRCKNYCSVIFWLEVKGKCCGYRGYRKVGFRFMRGHSCRYLEEIYCLIYFQSLSTHLNLLFATVVTFMDIKYVRGGGSSFLDVRGNVSISVSGKDIQYKYLWSEGTPSLNTNDYYISLIRIIT